MQVEGKNYYELLGVSRDATTADITAAYKELARIFHPDSHFYTDIIDTPISDADNEVFKLITAAYDTLRSTENRARYDKTLLSDALPRWGDESPQPRRPEETPFIYKAMQSPSGSFRSPTRGFGSVRYKASYLDLEQQIRPVSEVIHLKRGLWGRIRRLFRLY